MNKRVPNEQFDDLVEREPDYEGLDLRAIWRVLRRYKWGILSLTLIATLATAVWVNSLPPIYKATVSVVIEPKAQRFVGIEDVYNPMASATWQYDYYATQFEILRSRELAERVITKLSLGESSEFVPKPKEEQSSWWQGDWRKHLPLLSKLEQNPPVEPNEETKLNNLIDAVVGRTTVTPVRGTQLVVVSFEARNPRLAAQVANELANAYIESGLEARLSMTRKATSWLTARLAGLKDKLEASEQQLQGYREREGLLEAGGVGGFAKAALSDSSTKLIAARGTRTELESIYRQIEAAGGDLGKLANVPRIIDEPLVQSSKRVYLETQQEVIRLRSSYGPKHPKMQAAARTRDEAYDAYRRQVNAAADSVRRGYEIAQANEEALSGMVSSSREGVQTINRKEQQLRVLEREVETNQQLYDLFLSRFKETSATGDIDTVNARIMDTAVLPRVAFKPNKRRTVLIAAFLSMLAGIGLAFLLNHLDNTVKTAEDLESLVGWPVVGVLPLLKRSQLQGTSAAEVLIHSPRTAFSESIRTIRTGVMLAGLDVPRQRIVVTSSMPGEGKTTVASGLAYALGQMERVLLVDADLRRPTIGSTLGLDRSTPGLAELAAGTHELEDCIHQIEDHGIDVLPAGAIPPNPLELLASKRFEALLNQLDETYTRIVFDSPPCQAVSDAVVLSNYANGLLLVVGADRTPRPVVLRSMKRLHQVETHVVGTVLNRVHLRKSGRYYGSYQYYKYDQYGDYYGKNSGG